MPIAHRRLRAEQLQAVSRGRERQQKHFVANQPHLLGMVDADSRRAAAGARLTLPSGLLHKLWMETHHVYTAYETISEHIRLHPMVAM
jgi:hypothetical protein